MLILTIDTETILDPVVDLARIKDKFIVIKKVDSSRVPVTITSSSGQTIDGQRQWQLSVQFQSISLVTSDYRNYCLI